jgi:hypothetical protein
MATSVDIISGNTSNATSRNLLGRNCRGDWLLMIDDDQVFAPDMLQRLLGHLADPTIDAVVPHILRRYPPYGGVLATFPTDGGEPQRFAPAPEQRGLIDVDAAGTGVMLIRRRVFEQMPFPWFEVGQIWSDKPSPDLWFCKKLKDLGGRLVCDLDIPVGHLAPMAIWPRWEHGRWVAATQYLQGACGSLTPEFCQLIQAIAAVEPAPKDGSRSKP